MILESEFAGALRVMQQDVNISSRVLRDAWDRGDLATLTKNSPARARRACTSIIGHITAARPELEQLQSAYLEAVRHFLRRRPLPTRELCEAYHRRSDATKAWVEYVRQTGELCRFPVCGPLPMIEREYNSVAKGAR